MKAIGIDRIVCVIAISVLIICCAPAISKSYEIDSSDFKPLQKDTPLKNISPKTFEMNDIRDMRSIFDTSLVYKYRSNNDMVRVNLDKPVAAVIQIALRHELERNGHKYLPNSQGAKPDFYVAGSVFRFEITENGVNDLTGLVAVKLTLVKASDKKSIYTNKYEGSYNHKISPEKNRAEQETQILNKALLELLSKISTDPELIEFISGRAAP